MEVSSETLSILLGPDMLARMALQIVLFCASAFFSGSETALFSLSRMDLRQLRRERSPYAETLHALLDQPRRLIISILCGNQIVNMAATVNLTGILVKLYGVEAAAWISSFVMVPLLLLFGEATPKTIAVSDPVKVSTKIVARPMRVWVALATPLNWAVRRIADPLTTLIVGREKAPENLLQIDEFRTLVEEGVVSGEMTATERALIYNLLQAGITEIVEIMTPRTRMVFIDGALPAAQAIEQFIAYRYGRVPVFRESRDNVVGFLHAEDILELTTSGADFSKTDLDEVLHPPVMVPLTKKIDEMFDYFQSHEIDAAAVLNEFGGVDGFITMNDVLEYIFGRPHPDLSRPDIFYDSEADIYEVPGEMKLIDLNKLTNFGIEDSRMTTIAGVTLRALDRLPKVGDTVALPDFAISVTAMEGHRISRLRIGRGKAEAVGETRADADRVNGGHQPGRLSPPAQKASEKD